MPHLRIVGNMHPRPQAKEGGAGQPLRVYGRPCKTAAPLPPPKKTASTPPTTSHNQKKAIDELASRNQILREANSSIVNRKS